MLCVQLLTPKPYGIIISKRCVANNEDIVFGTDPVGIDVSFGVGVGVGVGVKLLVRSVI